ncbi:hypothetical protein [Enemella evansiae]|uniref:hypothetical protein n=1 Tax=Enemella evansiae TaxID=2016499 RepID=UPI00113FC56B|nr:hypothetical protein [Enemella evansiae]
MAAGERWRAAEVDSGAVKALRRRFFVAMGWAGLLSLVMVVYFAIARRPPPASGPTWRWVFEVLGRVFWSESTWDPSSFLGVLITLCAALVVANWASWSRDKVFSANLREVVVLNATSAISIVSCLLAWIAFWMVVNQDRTALPHAGLALLTAAVCMGSTLITPSVVFAAAADVERREHLARLDEIRGLLNAVGANAESSSWWGDVKACWSRWRTAWGRASVAGGACDLGIIVVLGVAYVAVSPGPWWHAFQRLVGLPLLVTVILHGLGDVAAAIRRSRYREDRGDFAIVGVIGVLVAFIVLGSVTRLHAPYSSATISLLALLNYGWIRIPVRASWHGYRRRVSPRMAGLGLLGMFLYVRLLRSQRDKVGGRIDFLTPKSEAGSVGSDAGPSHR